MCISDGAPDGAAGAQQVSCCREPHIVPEITTAHGIYLQKSGSNPQKNMWRSVYQRRWCLGAGAALHHFALTAAEVGWRGPGKARWLPLSYFSHKIFGKMQNVTCGEVNTGNIIKNFEAELCPGVEGRERWEREVMEGQGREGWKRCDENRG